MNHLSKLFIVIFVAALWIASGCKKLPTDTSLLVLNFNPYFGSDSLVLGKSYRNAAGDSISFGRTSFYVSQIQLITTDGIGVAVPGFILVTPTTGQNIIAGSVPTGTYKSISFSIGIQADSNHIDPSNYASGPLGVQTPAMHFSTDANGYIFMAAEGLIDSTHNNQSPNKAFSYHIGTDSLYKTVNLPDHSGSPYNSVFNATGTKVLTINVIADFGQLLQNINVAQQPVTNSTDYVLLADSLAAHIPATFRYQN